MRPFVIPAFVPPVRERGTLLDPPGRPPCRDLDAWMERVAAQIESALDTRPPSRSGRSEVGFFGASFGRLEPGIRKRLLDVAGKYLGTQVDALRVVLEPGEVADPLLGELAGRGVRTVELDVGSFDDDALTACGLSHGPADAVAAAERIKAAGLELGIVLRPGMPGSTPAEALRSARRAAELAPAFVRVYPVLVLAGTPLASAFGSRRYRPFSLDEAVGICTDLLLLFEGAGIPVSRVGLQPAVDLDEGGVVIAGPHHPSLRALAEAAIWYERAVREIAGMFRFQRELTLVVSPKDESRLRGPQGSNIRRLREKFRLAALAVRVDPAMVPGTVHAEAPAQVGAGEKKAG